ncbi:MAG: divalent cation tolerance protein CutA [Holosporaceae bacterium]|nr:MAG: divalent cation tolerance protein CutA [Holosporaceae bacterium]
MMILKTVAENFSKIDAIFAKHHPYECYCLVEMPLTKSNSNLHDWAIQQSTP